MPASIGNISSLEKIDLALNHLVGEIPNSIGRLRNVTWLTLGDNNFTGVFPPPLYNLSNLEDLDLGGNNFSGSLRHDFGLIFPKVQRLALGNSKFTGSIPPSLSNASKLYLIDLPSNNFLGTIPTSFGNLNLNWLNVFENSLGRNGIDDLSFITSLTNCSMLRYLDISLNQFGGDLPYAITNLSANLYHLALHALDIGGSVPTDIDRLANLNSLALSVNHLTDAIPASIGMLPNLKELFLEKNKLSGMIPPSFGNLTQILLINLSENLLEGSIPTSLERCTSLTTLDVSNNNFVATIPRVIFHLKSLQELVMSNNSLGGSLPYEIGDLEHLSLLDVSYNRFSGYIPRELGNCLTLEELYLQGNIFEGNIPDLSKLKGLKLIDLSRNNLSGEFPKDMVNLTSLQNFNLSFNNLVGEVPLQGIFKNAKAIEVFGNKNLCGGIRELNLKPCPKQKFEKPRKHLSWKLKLVIIIVSSFLAVAFFIISLFFATKKKKRSSLSSPSIELYPKITYTELYNATSRFSSSNIIGIGNFGTVYKGLLNPGETLVAIKVLNLAQHGASKSFMAECQALSTVRHRNLLKVLTVYSTSDYKGNDFQALVYDFMTHGSLDMWLHAKGEGGQKNLSLLDRINIAFGVASALCYLHHECPTPVVHCDLKPSNVLLDDDMTAHVSDFGLARLLPESSYAISNHSSSTGIRGTIGYVAPEYGIGGQVSTSGDVYSFGILILEMFTGRRPTDELFKDGLNIQTFVKLSLPERVMDIVDQSISCGKQLEEASSSRAQEEWQSQKATCLISIIKVGLSCSEESPRDRLSMKEVVTELQHIKEKFLRK